MGLFGKKKATPAPPPPPPPKVAPAPPPKPAPPKTAPPKSATPNKQWKIVMIGTTAKGKSKGKEITVTDDHKNKMCFQSPYFKMMFHQFDQAGEKLHLSVDGPGPCTIAINWFATGVLKDSEGKRPDLLWLGEIWCLAKTFQCPKLANAAMDNIYWRMVNDATDGMIIPFTKFVNDGQGNSRSLLQKIAFLPLTIADNAKFAKLLQDYSAEEIMEIAKFLKSRVGSPTPPATMFHTK